MAIAEAPRDDDTEVTTVADYAARPLDELHDGLQQLLAVKHSVDAELAKMAAGAEQIGLHLRDGATGMGPWLSMVGRLSTGNGFAYAKVGKALAHLPHLARAFSEGRLSFDQVRPAVRFVTPETDEEMAARLPGWSVRQIEDAAREAKLRTTKDAKLAHQRRTLGFRDDPEAGGGHINAFLPAEKYEAAKNEITRRADKIGKDAATGLYDAYDHRLADAFSELMDQAGSDRDPQHPAVVVHVDAEVLEGTHQGNGRIGAIPVAREVVLRLLCAMNVEMVVEAEDGTKAVGIGRLSRHIPRWLRRLVLYRDGVCRFPGCDRKIRHLHHCTEWSPPTKGETNDDNLIGLCWAHHHLVHEGGWLVRGDPRAQVEFLGPLGQRLTSQPDGLRSEIRRRVYGQRRRAHGLPA